MQTFHLCSRADRMIVSHKAVTETLGYICSCCRLTSLHSRQHRGGGDHHYKDSSLSKLWHFALSNSPGSVLLEYFFSAKLFFHLLSPPHHCGCLKVSSPFHVLAGSSPVRLMEVIGGARSWPGSWGRAHWPRGFRLCRCCQALLKAEGGGGGK